MTNFTWDSQKELLNISKHNVDFNTAALAFDDPNRRIMYDSFHSQTEDRFFCFGKVANKILTVRFTYRKNAIRIIGAGYWRRGKTAYEKKRT